SCRRRAASRRLLATVIFGAGSFELPVTGCEKEQAAHQYAGYLRSQKLAARSPLLFLSQLETRNSPLTALVNKKKRRA
ncbi:MAG: hypothetical protein NWR61_07415, partial [Pseudomonadales bacterium]|nr:hypothetical protein [Pseudomonadales bacterium]MDP4766161.1 hypothetical protein [Pseudomonadales bacterium]